MEKYLYKGKDEKEILHQALEELNLEEKDVFYKVSEEKSGLLKTKKKVVEIVKVKDVAELGKNLLENIIENIGIESKIETKIRDNLISYNLYSNNNSILIGKRGRILNAIQIYIRQAIYKKINIKTNIVIDIENYKSKQLYFLIRDVKKIAREVTLSKVSVKLDPMNSYERREIHNALSKFDYIKTESEGEEPNRYVVIKYKDKNENEK